MSEFIIPPQIGWQSINERLNKLSLKGINHFSFGFPEGVTLEEQTEIRAFFEGMLSLMKITNSEDLTENKPTEWFMYPQGNTPGFEHLLWPVNRTFFHIEIDCDDSDEQIKEVYPEAWEEQPHMFWLTVAENFQGILWAVIITNKRT